MAGGADGPGGTPTSPQVTNAVRATYTAFFGAGLATATWASRIPQLQEHLHLSAAQLGVALLALSGGSVVSLLGSGWIVHHLGARRTVQALSLVLAVGLLVIGLGYGAGLTVTLIGFALTGFGHGAWDVAMNIHAGRVEQALGRSIMSRFHAGYSIGTVVGALLGAAMVALHVPVLAHLTVIAVLVVVGVPYGASRFLPEVEPSPAAALEQDAPRAGHLLRRWSEPRTLLIGMFVLAFGLGEGVGNDWTAIALIHGHHVPTAVGTLGFATFLAAMTTTRWLGPGLLARLGRVVLLRGLAVTAVCGVVLFALAPWVWLAFLGAVAWGFGVSLGFPVGMSAASDEPAAAAGRTSVVSSIGYLAFLGGPPLIGLLAGHGGVRHALLVLLGPLALAVVIAPALRPRSVDA